MAPSRLGEIRGSGPRRRSRYGCRNCKLRKLKCDESKPQCKRCHSFGVLCNFISNVPDLQPISADTGRKSVVRGITQLRPPVASAVWTSDESTSFQLDARCQDFVMRYLGRCLITSDDPNQEGVNHKLLSLAFTHPFLMHASLAVSFTYDRHLNAPPGCRRSLEECYHWSRSSALLNKRLREPIETKDKDPIWGATAALALLAFSSPDASTPEESWPLKSVDHSDLDWLHMSKGKMSLWEILDPLRPDSLFSDLSATYADMYSPLPETGIDGIPRALATVCQLNESSTAKSNTWFYAAHAVSRILGLPDSQVTLGHTQLFTLSIHDPFENSLKNRDPVALLLLYLWYHKAGRSVWWIGMRARLECPSICSYLRRYHKGSGAILAFLPKEALAVG